MDIATREAAVLWPTYLRPPVEFVRGEGVRLWDEHGRSYLDFLGGIAVVAAGHAHPKVVSAVAGQLATLGHTSNLYFTGPQVDLAERLVDRFGGGAKVFFSNSGAEAVEACEGGFHGRTLGALAATGKPAIKEAFEPLPPGFRHVPFGDAGALATAIGPDTAAVLVEPIQGEAGIRVPPDGYLEAVREITARAGVLMMVDEIQSGMGRTGRFFAHQHAGIRPDVVTMAKALGSGFPIGATIAVDEVASAMRPGDHGTTFGGNPVACAAAMATLDVIEPLLEGHVANVSRRLGDGLWQLRDRIDTPGAALRGTGLWFGLDLGQDGPASAKDAAAAALSRGLVVNPVTETVLRLAPPLVVEEAEVEEGLLRLGGALEEVGVCR